MKKFVLVISFILLFVTACGGGYTAAEAPFEASEEQLFLTSEDAPAPVVANGEASFAVYADTDAVAEPQGAVPGQDGVSNGRERLIIRTADLSIIVTDTETTMTQIAEMAEANGGWVVTSGLYQYNETAKTGNITIRVPAEGFNSALAAIKGLATEVSSESSSGQDVTEEYVDLDSRLQNLEATADRVRSFLDSATKVEDALAVNAELSRLEGEIEVIKGRMQYLSQSASFSTITVNLTPDVLSQPIEIGGWQPEGIAREAIEALVSTLQGVTSALIWFGLYVLPLLLLFGLPVMWVVRYVRQRWNRRPAAPAANSQG